VRVPRPWRTFRGRRGARLQRVLVLQLGRVGDIGFVGDGRAAEDPRELGRDLTSDVPSGNVPFHRGPTIANWRFSLPVVRLPIEPATLV
jgi:hypothetical protein